jgi:hypothetical protein
MLFTRKNEPEHFDQEMLTVVPLEVEQEIDKDAVDLTPRHSVFMTAGVLRFS